MYVGYVSLMRYNEIALKYVEMATYHFLYLSFFCQVEPFKLEKETREFFHLKEMPSQVPPEPNLSESPTVEGMASENKENRDIEANTIFLTENEKKTSSQNGRKKEGKSRKKESEKSGLGQIMDWYLTVISVPFNAAFMTIPDATLSHRHLISAILVSLFWIAGLTYVNNKVPYSLSFPCLILPLCFKTVHGRLDNKNWLHFGN